MALPSTTPLFAGIGRGGCGVAKRQMPLVRSRHRAAAVLIAAMNFATLETLLRRLRVPAIVRRVRGLRQPLDLRARAFRYRLGEEGDVTPVRDEQLLRHHRAACLCRRCR